MSTLAILISAVPILDCSKALFFRWGAVVPGHGENLEGVVVRGLEAELPGHVVVADGWGKWVPRGRWFRGGKVGRGGEVVVFVHWEGASRGGAGGEAVGSAGGEATAASLSMGASYNLSGSNIGGIDEDEDEDGDDTQEHVASSLLSSTSPSSSIRNEGIAQSTTGIDGESADEVLKRRNREHARQTRLRKKAYVVGLEHSLKDLQAQISKDAAKDSTREALRSTMEAETTLLVTAFFRGEVSLEMLARSAAQRVQLVSPVTPFRSFPPNDAFDGMTYSVGAHSIVAHSRSWLTFFKHTIGFATNGWCLAKIQGHTPAIEVKVMRLPSVLCCVVLCVRPISIL